MFHLVVQLCLACLRRPTRGLPWSWTRRSHRSVAVHLCDLTRITRLLLMSHAVVHVVVQTLSRSWFKCGGCSLWWFRPSFSASRATISNCEVATLTCALLHFYRHARQLRCRVLPLDHPPLDSPYLRWPTHGLPCSWARRSHRSVTVRLCNCSDAHGGPRMGCRGAGRGGRTAVWPPVRATLLWWFYWSPPGKVSVLLGSGLTRVRRCFTSHGSHSDISCRGSVPGIGCARRLPRTLRRRTHVPMQSTARAPLAIVRAS